MGKQVGVLLFISVCVFQGCCHNAKNSSIYISSEAPYDSSKSPMKICGLRGFTESAAEHIINEILEPFVVREIKGKISNDEGGWQKDYLVLFEIRGVDQDSKIIRAYTDEDGNFVMKDIPQGRYCFKATVLGLQSVMGVIFVDKTANPKSRVVFKMHLGV